MRYGYQERFSEIVALVNAHPSILGGLNAEKLRGVKMAYQLQAEKIKHQQCENAARPSLIKEILDLKKEGE